MTILPVKGTTLINKAAIASGLWGKLLSWNVHLNEDPVAVEAREKGTSMSEKLSNWHHWHPDMLRFSTSTNAMIFELVVTRPELKAPLKIYYHHGKTQFCESQSETFSMKKLI